MARIAGINIPNEKRIEISLTYIKGIGLSSSQKILAEAGIDANTRTKDISEAEITKIRDILDKKHLIEGDLVREVTTNIKRLKDTGSYRGLRHKAGLPTRGQRTKTNARTKKGKKVTVGSGRKKAVAKT